MKPKNAVLDQAILAYKADLKGTLDAEITRLESLNASIDSKIGLLDTIEKFNEEKNQASKALDQRHKTLQSLEDRLVIKEMTLDGRNQELQGREERLQIRERVVAGKEDILKEREAKILDTENLLQSLLEEHKKEVETRCAGLDERSAILDKREEAMRQLAVEIHKVGNPKRGK